MCLIHVSTCKVEEFCKVSIPPTSNFHVLGWPIARCCTVVAFLCQLLQLLSGCRKNALEFAHLFVGKLQEVLLRWSVSERRPEALNTRMVSVPELPELDDGEAGPRSQVFDPLHELLAAMIVHSKVVTLPVQIFSYYVRIAVPPGLQVDYNTWVLAGKVYKLFLDVLADPSTWTVGLAELQCDPLQLTHVPADAVVKRCFNEASGFVCHDMNSLALWIL